MNVTIEQEWDKTLHLLQELTPRLLTHGITVKELEVRLSDFNIYAVIDAYHWLKNIENLLDEHDKIFSRHDADTWQMYQAMGILKQLREGSILVQLRKDVRAAWRGRPQILKQTKRNNETSDATTESEEDCGS